MATFKGTAGSDVLKGSDFDDHFDGNGGWDTMQGGRGNDTYVVDDQSDLVIERPGEGIDTVLASGSYVLYAEIENLTLLDDWRASSGTGNALDNRITGTSANNILAGLAGNDTLIGGSGDDRLYGGDGVDCLAGDDDNDTLDGGFGGDVMWGGRGNDIFIVDTPFDNVVEYANEGTDEVRTALASYNLAGQGNVENLTYLGTSRFSGQGNGLANVIAGGAGHDRLDGGAGDDRLIGGAGDDLLLGGLGTDRLEGGAGTDQMWGGDGNDTLDGGAGGDEMGGGAGNDLYVVDSLYDVLFESINQGTDEVRTTLSAYSLAGMGEMENLTYGGTGQFTGQGNSLRNVITGGAGNDTLDGGAGTDTMRGGLGDDTYVVDALFDSAIELAGEGVDTIRASIGWSLQLSANVENLTLLDGGNAIAGSGNERDNVIAGNASGNLLSGGGGNDRILGGLGNDLLYGGAGDDVLLGESGNDTLHGDTGGDDMSGGAGSDIYVVDSFLDRVSEGMNQGTDEVRTTLWAYTLPGNVENLTYSGTPPFYGTGNILDNVIIGGAGDDELIGYGGRDRLIGGAGNDALGGGIFGGGIFEGGLGDDWLEGGAGNDTYFVWSFGDQVIEQANQGIDTVYSSTALYMLDPNVENLVFAGIVDVTGIGNDLDNVIRGSLGDDWLAGGGGADTLAGNTGNDTYIVDTSDVVIETANAGTDRVQTSGDFALPFGAEIEVLETTNPTGITPLELLGNEFGNTIGGNDGDNIIAGTSSWWDTRYDGRDVMTGRGGADTFVWTSTAETSVVLAEADVVTDFNRSEGDLLSFFRIDADETIPGPLPAFTFVGTDPFTAPAQVRYFTDNTDTFIQLNTDADLAPEATIRLVGLHLVEASWFEL
jgi:Ca2+-binding RTX toxin-like protein